MPEDIPEPAARLTDEEVAWRASDWSDFRRDYGSHDDAVRSREFSAFCAGWDARHLSPRLTAGQQAVVDQVRHMVEASSHVAASITDALYTDAADRAEADAIANASPLQRAALTDARALLAGEEACTCADLLPEGKAPAPCSVHGWVGEPPTPAEHDHRPVQHRDGRAPWCRICGLDADGNAPASRFTTRREAREAALREKGDAIATAASAGTVTADDLARAAGRPIPDAPQA
ncbi:hypothetical protein SEA_KOZIE_88 [Microbacterium phage Kozie]|uniref:Uncharacterized protein n=1 Tax=Microbacterium phage Kozie TaxID=2885981 RepID=A0AAE8Y7T8_9CAUD|nr:hypothetical protein QC998_gp88 [Microbacterium phage Kozie]UDL16284.1 hypothetical protein SEA_KOZIE_88 [Microbacterium phage Kozie]